MTLTPQPSAFETRSNATYEALIWALSRPGLLRTLPDAGQAPICEALIDRECSVHCAPSDLAEQAARAGAALVAFPQADHVFLPALPRAEALRDLRIGSDLYPEEGATLVLDATLGSGTRLRLTGPGVEGAVEVAVDGLPEGFWQERARVMRYPMGFELFLVDGARVLGVPRSTHVEVL